MNGAREVEVWSVDTTVPVPGGETLLGPAERARSARFVSGVDASRYVHAHVAARTILARRTGLSLADVGWEVGPHGKPGPVVGQRWNLSRSGGTRSSRSPPPTWASTCRCATPRRRGPCRGALPRPRWTDRGAADDWRRLARLEACAKAVGGRLLDVLGLDVTTPGSCGPTAARGTSRSGG